MRELRSRAVPAALLVVGMAAFAWVADAQMVRPGGPQVPFGPCPTPDNRVPISSLPFTIDSCGSYFLVDCLTGAAGQNGITIESDDVTLDLNGFSLVGVPGSGSGVQVQPGFSGITVEGGGIFGWDVNGIDANNGEAIRVEGVKVRGVGVDGIAVAAGSAVSGCVIRGVGGIGIKATNALVRGNSATGNGTNIQAGGGSTTANNHTGP